MAMWVGALQFDLLLGDVHSLKEKRSLVRPLIAEVRKRLSSVSPKSIISTAPPGGHRSRRSEPRPGASRRRTRRRRAAGRLPPRGRAVSTLCCSSVRRERSDRA